MMRTTLYSLLLAYFILRLTCVYAQSETIAPPEMIPITGGSFKMGSESGGEDEKPVHTVTLSPYAISKTEVTVAQYRSFCTATKRNMPVAPTWGWVDTYPMTRVSWEDAVAYCNWLSTTLKDTFRLPTEAEWEFASRGNAYDQTYAGGNEPDKVAWFAGNSTKRIQFVAKKLPNTFGLYDMSGNAAEWCSDWYDEASYTNSLEKNPTGAADGYQRVVRGGSADFNEEFMRCTFRNRANPDNPNDFIGFRVVKQ